MSLRNSTTYWAESGLLGKAAAATAYLNRRTGKEPRDNRFRGTSVAGQGHPIRDHRPRSRTFRVFLEGRIREDHFSRGGSHEENGHARHTQGQTIAHVFSGG